ncbi:hypothetical protein ACN20G_27870 (plasmid) [Streptomyces sp. BI20]|uniref:serine hydrolase n=1 Tax=Streptomyces sp. BI20 TaxID=3403460 RepID=UPI003C7788BD
MAASAASVVLAGAGWGVWEWGFADSRSAGAGAKTLAAAAGTSAAPARPDAQTVLSQELAAAWAEAVPAAQGRFALGVRDVRTGAVAVAGQDDFRFNTASVVKSHILAATLLKAQDEKRELTAFELRQVVPMIRQSANEPATALWPGVGRDAGMKKAYERFGMTETSPGTLDRWGLTTTTVRDQLRFLEMLHSPDSPLNETSRAYQLNLMSTLDKDQIEGGVHTIADPGSTYAAKDGWLPRSQTGLWVINSIGRLPVSGRLLDIVVLSQDQRSQDAGVQQGEKMLRAVMPRLVTALNERAT